MLILKKSKLPSMPMRLRELLRRKTDGASQFIGNSLKNSAVFLVLYSLQGQESWFPRPKSFSCNIYLDRLVFAVLKSLLNEGNPRTQLFAYGIDGQDQTIISESPGDSSYIQNLFLPSKKSIPDAILIPRSLSPPYEYIEGGE